MYCIYHYTPDDDFTVYKNLTRLPHSLQLQQKAICLPSAPHPPHSSTNLGTSEVSPPPTTRSPSCRSIQLFG